MPGVNNHSPPTGWTFYLFHSFFRTNPSHPPSVSSSMMIITAQSSNLLLSFSSPPRLILAEKIYLCQTWMYSSDLLIWFWGTFHCKCYFVFTMDVFSLSCTPFVCGIIFCECRSWSNMIWPPVLSHFPALNPWSLVFSLFSWYLFLCFLGDVHKTSFIFQYFVPPC